jgi:DDE superfamily endonuclease
MSLSSLPALLSRWLQALAQALDKRSAPRLLLLLLGALCARGRRTVTSWFRPAGITDDFRPAYHALAAAGRRVEGIALRVLLLVLKPWMTPCRRLVFALDDSPTPRYGPCVEGAGIHHNPTPGPAGEKFVYGHVWVTLAWLVRHARWGSLALPLLARLYVRSQDVARLPQGYRWEFRTKLQLAAELLRWLVVWVRGWAEQLWVVADGGYAKKAFLRAAKEQEVTVVSRLRKDAALWTLPPAVRPPGRRGPLPTYGKGRIDLAKRAGQRRGWQRLECVQYGVTQVKQVKSFLATWRPAGGVIRVVLVQEARGWVAFFGTDPSAAAADLLEVVADRGALEQAFKDLKEVWGAGQQQVRHLYASLGAFHVSAWLYTLVEAWSWERAAEALVDRQASPWDEKSRRPSHAEKRKALQGEILAQEIRGVVGEATEVGRFQEVARRLLSWAA